jgi:hypothetical protein
MLCKVLRMHQLMDEIAACERRVGIEIVCKQDLGRCRKVDGSQAPIWFPARDTAKTSPSSRSFLTQRTQIFGIGMPVSSMTKALASVVQSPSMQRPVAAARTDAGPRVTKATTRPQTIRAAA